jgi:bifunctional enzyme CysN/CysC
MSTAETIVFDAAARLHDAAERPPLRFLTCGSVDDGKSTLLGRLLYEQNLILEDHLAALERDSGKYGTSGPEIDFSLLLDGLEAEREQRITIDVAYRYFATRRRAFVVADTPGHEQYTRNMATRPDAASRDDRQPLGHSPRRPGGEQDRSGRLRPRRFRSDR